MEMPLTPLEFSRRARKLYAGRVAVIDGELKYTYSQFFDRCDRWSYALQQMGIVRGDRVAYIATNTHAQLEAFYSVPQTGAILVPVNYRLSAEEFAYIINHSGAVAVCVHSDYLTAVENIKDQLPGVKHFIALEGEREGWVSYEKRIKLSRVKYAPVDIQEQDLITINYTSGTTARPKGVMITHRNAYMNSIGSLVHFDLSVKERYLWTLPMFHANGWTFVWTITACGGTHVCLRKTDAQSIFHFINRESITLFCAAPTVLISIVNAPEGLRKQAPAGIRVITAGAPPAAATIERIENELGWNLIQVYGLTETAPFISICEPLPEHCHLTPSQLAVIKARQGVELITSGELMVIDGEDNEVPHDGNTMGEIVARGNVVMKGYYNDPEATNKVLVNGWFHTGDMAVIHPDGYIEIRDRAKDIIISGGENISSVEVESVLLRHPSVKEVAIVGMPHEKWGQSPHAFVVLHQGYSVTEDNLRSFVGQHLASFKKPQWVTFVKELPKTATGKIQKYVLRGGRSNI
ncbi:o-succinylbenzoate--CoA ligase [Terrimonas sp.]|uniref:long-chain-fatty-acid--CoA ligase n=1 Tax=Terrimonas sp. TaxID=1914338 RepID=UPI000D516040|nr:long-chain-fatty-acid--CoA ligase [Terrimonas sp.]PVD49937.1 o-succinylbenzoate--CoA ligase [Terrimonas sp.]